MPETPPFSPTIALLAMARSRETALAESLRPLGLTTRKYGLLGHIGRAPDISFSELARRSRITVQSTHVAIASFAAAGLVEDATAQAGVASRLRITATGRSLLEDAAERVAALDAEFTATDPDLTEALRQHLLAELGFEPISLGRGLMEWRAAGGALEGERPSG